jgi:adenine-specific DNA-methyltransferase
MPSAKRQFTPPVFEPNVTAGARKLRGIYYTPPEIVRRIVDLTLGPRIQRQSQTARAMRILDPSCGAGEFLVAAYQQVRESLSVEKARTSVWGIDVDAAAVEVARSRLLALDPEFPTSQVIVSDTLTTRNLAAESFDAIIGNPPYVNIRQLAKTLSAQQIESLRQTYSAARGNFDLYVLFVERAIKLLRPGGGCGFIIPSKWATLEYARQCRRLLLSQTTIEHVIDLSNSHVFAAASVYPHILVFKKVSAKPSHAIQFAGYDDREAVAVLQASLSDEALQFSPPLDVESRIATAPLASVATIACGTTGYAAQTISRRIVDAAGIDQAAEQQAADFITSGNIDRYHIQLGNVRYLNRRYVRPRLPLNVPELTSVKQRLFKSPKIVVAGMSRRLEAAWDSDGLALGVQVFAVSDFRVDPYYLLAVLNSRLLSYLFATRYAAKRLGGGYLAINKGQLVRLPIRLVPADDHADAHRARHLARLARNWSPSQEATIDQQVFELYRLSSTEIARVEGHFADLEKAAA